jgi:hypothetical protein
MQNDFANDPKWPGFANSNDYAAFRLLAKKGFKDIAAQRYVRNDSFFMRIFDKPEFGEYITDRFIKRLHNKRRNGTLHRYLTGRIHHSLAAGLPLILYIITNYVDPGPNRTADLPLRRHWPFFGLGFHKSIYRK